MKLVCYFCNRFTINNRDVAQSGSVLVWGARGRKFKSCHPDLKIKELANIC